MFDSKMYYKLWKRIKNWINLHFDKAMTIIDEEEQFSSYLTCIMPKT